MKPLPLKPVPEPKGHYIAGFADGEGSFNVSFRKRDDFLLGWKVTPVFNITQKERVILSLVKHYLGCGTIRPRKNGVWVYEVDSTRAVRKCVIPFFKRFPFLSQEKKRNFENFQRVIELKEKSKSLTLSNISQILDLLDGVESKGSRKYGREEVVERARTFWERNRERVERINKSGLESPETTRQTQETGQPLPVMI